MRCPAILPSDIYKGMKRIGFSLSGGKKTSGLQGSVIGERIIGGSGNDYVVHKLDVAQLCGICQLPRLDYVVFAGLAVSARMVVDQNNGAGKLGKGPFEYHLHVKDGVDGHPKALGEGNCDLISVVRAAKAMELEWLIVENDDPVPNGFEDIARSLTFLKALIKSQQ